jgi:hypothetical protein
MTALIAIEIPVHTVPPYVAGASFNRECFSHSSRTNVRITVNYGSSPLLAAGYLPAGRPTCIVLAEMTAIHNSGRCVLSHTATRRQVDDSQRVKLKRVKHRLIRSQQSFARRDRLVSVMHSSNVTTITVLYFALHCCSTHIY